MQGRVHIPANKGNVQSVDTHSAVKTGTAIALNIMSRGCWPNEVAKRRQPLFEALLWKPCLFTCTEFCAPDVQLLLSLGEWERS